MARVKLVKRPPPPAQQARTIRETAKSRLRQNLLEPVKRRHDEIVGPWEVSADQPAFEVVDESDKGRVYLRVRMDADAAESASLSVWQLLNRGTSVRYMQLSEDWESKTAPGQPFSGPGAGEKLGLDVGRPQQGIEAREFDEAVAQEFDADAIVKRAIDEGFNRNFR